MRSFGHEGNGKNLTYVRICGVRGKIGKVYHRLWTQASELHEEEAFAITAERPGDTIHYKETRTRGIASSDRSLWCRSGTFSENGLHISTPFSMCNGEGLWRGKMQKFHFHCVQLVVMNNKSIWRCGSQGRLVSWQHSKSSLTLNAAVMAQLGTYFKKACVIMGIRKNIFLRVNTETVFPEKW